MVKSFTDELTTHLEDSVRSMCQQGGVTAPARESYALAPPRSSGVGDLATNAALATAKLLRRPPMEVAAVLAGELRAHRYVAEANVAAPGFINVKLSDAAWGAVLTSVAERGDSFGDTRTGAGQRILLEFVSANPTGPMHVGHLRHAVTGDVMGRILEAAGFKVHREFYINDAGNQVATLGRSFRVRCYQAVGVDMPLEEGMYPGDYLLGMAREYVGRHHLTRERLDEMSEQEFTSEGKALCLALIKHELQRLDVRFDEFVSEKSLYESGRVQATLDRLKSTGATFDKEGATWLATTKYDDDRDRVLVKSDGSLTYLVPDLAYHGHKYERNFDLYINILGSDHIGYGPRLRAGIEALGHDPEKLEIITLRLVFLIDASGERSKGSKRKGDIVEAMDLADGIGMDVIRFFLLMRSTDSEIDFDLELAKEQSDRNPVFKVQYAHARIHSLFAKAHAAHLSPSKDPGGAAALLAAPVEREIILAISAFPETVERCALERAPHHMTRYLLGMAELWNRYWSAAKTEESLRIIRPEEPECSAARLALARAVQQVLANGLRLMGINAPDRLVREEED